MRVYLDNCCYNRPYDDQSRLKIHDGCPPCALRCLSENLGAQDTELFISTLLREKFDYTQWRQSFVDRIRTFDDLDALLQNQ